MPAMNQLCSDSQFCSALGRDQPTKHGGFMLSDF
jgi:hypothetical protein